MRVHQTRRDAGRFEVALARGRANLLDAAIVDHDIDAALRRLERAVVENAGSDDHRAAIRRRPWQAPQPICEMRETADSVDDELHGDGGDDDPDDSAHRIDAGLPDSSS